MVESGRAGLTVECAIVAPMSRQAGFESVEDDADEESFEAADRFASALPFGAVAFEVGAGGGVDPCLRDPDAVERRVELAVAAAVESVSLHPAELASSRATPL